MKLLPLFYTFCPLPSLFCWGSHDEGTTPCLGHWRPFNSSAWLFDDDTSSKAPSKDSRARSTNFPSFSPNSECWLFGGKPRWLESDSTDLPGQFGSEQRAWGGKALGRWRLPLCWLNHCHCFWSKWTISSRDWISLVVRLDHFRHSIKKDTKESQQIKEAHLNHFDHIILNSFMRN